LLISPISCHRRPLRTARIDGSKRSTSAQACANYVAIHQNSVWNFQNKQCMSHELVLLVARVLFYNALSPGLH
jgi:hypothetical protein